MADLITITVYSGTTAGSFNIYSIHFDELGNPDPDTFYLIDLNAPLSELLTGITYTFDRSIYPWEQQRAFGIVLINTADSNLGCVTGETRHYVSSIKLQNNFDINVGNLQITAASFGPNIILDFPGQDDGISTYHHIITEVPIVDTMSVTIKNNELYNLSYKITVIDSDSVSPFITTGNTLTGETVAVSFTGTSLSPARSFSVTLESLFRPSGLTDYDFCYQYNSNPDTGSTVFYGSLTGACDALNVINTESRGYSTTPGAAASLSIGENVYYNPPGSVDLTPLPTGYYLIGPDPFPPSSPDTVIYINNGIIESYPSCPTRGYGLLYNWYAINTGMLASAGWDVSTNVEWLDLYDYVGTSQAYKLIDPLTWPDYDDVGLCTNELGLSIGNGRYRNALGVFSELYMSYFWNAEEGTYPTYTGYGKTFQFYGCCGDWYDSVQEKNLGWPVRLVKNPTLLTHGQIGSYTGNDGKIYSTICIDDGVTKKEWVTINLAETKYNDTSTIPEITGNAAWTGDTAGALCVYNNNWNNV